MARSAPAPNRYPSPIWESSRNYQYIKLSGVRFLGTHQHLLSHIFVSYEASHVQQNRFQDLRPGTTVRDLASSCRTLLLNAQRETLANLTILLRIQKSNDPRDLEGPQPGAGLSSKPEFEAFKTPGPAIPNREALAKAGPPAVSSGPSSLF